MRIPVVCGPTASGKTAFAVELARRFGGEVISADCMLVYKGLNIGTAKPTIEEMCGGAASYDRHRLSAGEVFRRRL